MSDPGSFDHGDLADPAIFMLDCDNTLLDNDSLKSDLDRQLEALLGKPLLEQFWSVYEEVRVLTGTVDFPLTIERYRAYLPHEPVLRKLRNIIMDYPFASRLYPDSLATLEYLKAFALPAIVSDGDSIYQPCKIAGSGLAAAVDWRVLVYIHKEGPPRRHICSLAGALLYHGRRQAAHPCRYQTALSRALCHCACAAGPLWMASERVSPMPDITINSIGELRNFHLGDFKRYLSTQ